MHWKYNKPEYNQSILTQKYGTNGDLGAMIELSRETAQEFGVILKAHSLI